MILTHSYTLVSAKKPKKPSEPPNPLLPTVVKAPKKEYGPGTHILYYQGEQKGYLEHGAASPVEHQTANRMFPGVPEPTHEVKRLHGIYLDDDVQGRGFGQFILLKTLASQPNPLTSWYYNSQGEPGLTNSYLSLQKKGLIEIHFKRPPKYDGESGVHLVRITPLGLKTIQENPESLIKEKPTHPPHTTFE